MSQLVKIENKIVTVNDGLVPTEELALVSESTLQSYLATVVWTEARDEDGEIKDGMDISDFSPQAIFEATADLGKFLKEIEPIITPLIESADEIEAELYEDEAIALVATRKLKVIAACQDVDTIAHDFWLTRNHHGAGFWDGDYSESYDAGSIGEKLTAIADKFGEIWAYMGDDGLIYFSR